MSTLLLTRSDVERQLDPASCFAAVSNAFQQRGSGRSAPSGVLGIHVPDGGFHAKAAMLGLSRPYFVVKVNANFPGNPVRHGLPTIQGVLVRFDATNGVPLAVMDSMAITTLRTAAASAVAATHLARADVTTATFVGCGVQARAHVAALLAVRPLRRAFVFDLDGAKAARFAAEVRALHSVEVVVAANLGTATRASGIIVTSTSATTGFLGRNHVTPGTFVAAVGADSAQKQELVPGLLGACAVVVDDLDQCSTSGEWHHAIAAGVVAPGDVRATLADVVAGLTPGRQHDDEIIVFDSTGVAISDVAAASVVFERAVLAGAGREIDLAG